MIGKEILNYTIVSLIGKGGMGSVYLAENKYIKQQKVAIKVLNGDVTNDFTRQKLAEEADKLARLDHPHIVHFINYHIDEEGNIYLIMEHADGFSLEEYIKSVSGLIVEEKICAFFEPLLDAFDYAHKHKIIHKDIKPNNIIITKEGVPKVLDFGISTILNDDGTDTDADSDMIMGTPSYMSPEQVQGAALDARSDIYSLGVLLHQMLTGNPPYDTTTLTEHEIHKQIVEEQLPRMKTYYKYVSDKVQAIVDKATSKEPEQRFRSCQDFKKALHNAIYPPKVSVGLRVMMGAVAAIVVAGALFVWDYNRLKVSYYKDYVEQWGLPRGIGEISASARKHTNRMYRFEHQHYKLQRMSHVNSQGVVISDGESERSERPMDIAFTYHSNGQLSRAKVMDNNGKVQYIKSYSEKLNSVIFQIDDEYGTEKTIGSHTVGYVDAFATGQDRGKISRYLVEYDAHGHVSALRYAGFQNIQVGDAQGIYGKQYVRDGKGRVIEESYLGHDGNPKATKWGMGKKVFTYDDNDNWVKACYQTVDGKPALDDSDGTSIVEMSYDKYGNLTTSYYKTADGKLMLPGKMGCAGWLREYDDKGFVTKLSSVGIDGKVEINLKQGWAIMTSTYDANGFASNVTYLDAHSKTCQSTDGFTHKEMVYDERGNALEEWYYGIDGRPAQTKDGYAGIKAEYDAQGNMVKIGYYNTDKALCTVSFGYAVKTYDYNQAGDCVKEAHFDADMNPVAANLGVSYTEVERDARGNIVKSTNFDVEGKPTTSSEGVCIITYTYDDNGNEISRQFFDTEGKPSQGAIGYARKDLVYDERGYLVSDRYYNEQNKPVLVGGIAGHNYKRDDRGNIVEEYEVGIDSKQAKGKLIVRKKYDERDNLVETAVFEADGKPGTNTDNIHKFTQSYNQRNQTVETRYFNSKGQLTPYADTRFCIVKFEYNDKGQCTKASYFDQSEKPCVYDTKERKYAILAKEFDQYGRVNREFYYNEQGAPTHPATMVPERAYQYDKWGNMTYAAHCDGKGGLIVSPHTGWSYYRATFDNREHLLQVAFFNEKETAVRCKDGYHKRTNTYTKTGETETEAYFNVDNAPMAVNGYHMKQNVYDEAGLRTEMKYLNTAGKPTNSTNGFAKVTFSYNKDNTPRERKYYNAAGKMLLHEQYVNGTWVEVKYWQKDVTAFAQQLPMKVGEGETALTLASAKVAGASTVEFELVATKSKYEMSDQLITLYQDMVLQIALNLRKTGGLPRNVTIKCLLKDSKGRTLYTAKS